MTSSFDDMKNIALGIDNIKKYTILTNPLFNQEIIEILLNDSDPNIRYFSARHKKCSLDLLKILVLHKDFNIRQGIACNENSDEEILEILSKDRIFIVRRDVIFNAKTTEKILISLCKEFPNYVIKHPNCPEYIKILLK